MTPNRAKHRAAFSLLEVLIVVAILAVLVSLLTVGVQKARATAARVSCANNLYLIGLATNQYHVSHNLFPTESGNNPSFYKTILPYAEGKNAADSTPIAIFLCPARRNIAEVGAKRDFGYAASLSFEPRGPSILDAPTGVSFADIGRGGSNTFLLTTLWMDPKNYLRNDPTDFGWSAKQNSRPYASPAMPDGDPAGSIQHLGGPYSTELPVLFADGHVEWVPYLAFGDRWSYLPVDKAGKPIAPTPTGRTVVRITVPGNEFKVERDGPDFDDFDENP
jgi:prepilin-type N-terminal cleavage/methylation domain-containing protein/prepilin-type processing-associated H-X9-DG protein